MTATAGYAAVTVPWERDRGGRRLTIWLGSWAVVMLFQAALRMPYTITGPVSPAVVLSLIIASSMWFAAAIAALLVWSLRGAWTVLDSHRPKSVPFPSSTAEACGES